MSIVAQYKTIKKETQTFFKLEDLQNIIIDNLGEDIWNAVMYFTDEKIKEQEEESECDKEDILGYDADLTALRSDVRDTLDGIEELIQYVNDAKRIERSHLTDELGRMKRQLIESEGYI